MLTRVYAFILTMFVVTGSAFASLYATGFGQTQASAMNVASMKASNNCLSGVIWQGGWICEEAYGGWNCGRAYNCAEY